MTSAVHGNACSDGRVRVLSIQHSEEVTRYQQTTRGKCQDLNKVALRTTGCGVGEDTDHAGVISEASRDLHVPVQTLNTSTPPTVHPVLIGT